MPNKTKSKKNLIDHQLTIGLITDQLKEDHDNKLIVSISNCFHLVFNF